MSTMHHWKLTDALEYSKNVILNKALKLKQYVHRYIDVLVSFSFSISTKNNKSFLII